MFNFLSKIFDKSNFFLSLSNRGYDFVVGYFSFLGSTLTRNNNNVKHPFHLVEPSPLPILVSFILFFNLIYLLTTFHVNVCYFVEFRIFLFCLLLATAILWLMSAQKELRDGCHTLRVQEGFKMGILLFILSEVMLFAAFFLGIFSCYLKSFGVSWYEMTYGWYNLFFMDQNTPNQHFSFTFIWCFYYVMSPFVNLLR